MKTATTTTATTVATTTITITTTSTTCYCYYLPLLIITTTTAITTNMTTPTSFRGHIGSIQAPMILLKAQIFVCLDQRLLTTTPPKNKSMAGSDPTCAVYRYTHGSPSVPTISSWTLPSHLCACAHHPVQVLRNNASLDMHSEHALCIHFLLARAPGKFFIKYPCEGCRAIAKPLKCLGRPLKNAFVEHWQTIPSPRAISAHKIFHNYDDELFELTWSSMSKDKTCHWKIYKHSAHYCETKRGRGVMASNQVCATEASSAKISLNDASV